MRSGFCLRAALLAVLAALCVLPSGALAALDIHHDSTAVSEVGGGDGIISPNDSLAVTETVRSSEPGNPLTGITGTLATGTPNVSITQGSSVFSDLPFASTSSNATPFGVQLGPVECGQNVNLSLALHADQGTANVPFTIGTGIAGAPADLSSADVPHGIPDASTLTSVLPVGASGRIKQIAVHIGKITHPYDGDLRIALIAPDGTRVVLVDQRGGQAADFVNSTITPDQGSPIAGGTAPFTGTYVADGDLSRMVGLQEHGTWQLEVTDLSPGDVGTLNSWGLTIATASCAAQPVASFTATPNPALPGETVQLDASATHDPVGTITDYQWDLDGDGTFETDTGTTPTVSTSFSTRGAYPVSVKVSDDGGKENVFTRTINVTHPPTAALTYDPVAPQTKDTVTLKADGSSDPDGPIVDYQWDLNGDGIYEEDTGGVAVNTTSFDTPGVHTVSVLVTDTDGATAAKSVEITATNRPPQAVIADPGLGIVGQSVNLDASASNDPDGTITDYEWDLDNNGSYETDAGMLPTLQPSFGTAGSRTVGLRVTDSDGATSTTTVTFNVTHAPTVALSATPNPARPSQTVSLDASGSTDPDGGPVSFQWDLDGNGSYETDTGAVATESVSWAQTGTHTIHLKVTDSDGASTIVTRDIAVVNELPVPAVTLADGAAVAGVPVTFDGSGSVDPDGTIAHYQWDLDGNGSFETDGGSLPRVVRTYPNAGTLSLKLKVTDNDGASAVLPFTLVVNPPSTGGGTGGGTGGTGGGTGGTGGTGGGTGGSGGTGGTGGAGGTPQAFSAGLGGAPIQALKLVRKKGVIRLLCTTNRAARCAVTATLDAGTAKKLRLAKVRRAATVGKAAVTLTAAGDGRFSLKLTAKARKALKRAKKVRVLLKGTAIDSDGSKIALARVVLLR